MFQVDSESRRRVGLRWRVFVICQVTVAESESRVTGKIFKLPRFLRAPGPAGAGIRVRVAGGFKASAATVTLSLRSGESHCQCQGKSHWQPSPGPLASNAAAAAVPPARQSLSWSARASGWVLGPCWLQADSWGPAWGPRLGGDPQPEGRAFKTRVTVGPPVTAATATSPGLGRPRPSPTVTDRDLEARKYLIKCFVWNFVNWNIWQIWILVLVLQSILTGQMMGELETCRKTTRESVAYSIRICKYLVQMILIICNYLTWMFALLSWLGNYHDLPGCNCCNCPVCQIYLHHLIHHVLLIIIEVFTIIWKMFDQNYLRYFYIN